MEETNEQEDPDEDVGHDAARQIVAMNGDGSVPEQCGQGPGVGSGDGRQVHKGWETAMTPVGDALVDEVGHEDDLGTPEVVTSPEQDPGKGEQVVQDEMGGYIGSRRHDGGVFVEEMPDIAHLGENQEDPREHEGFIQEDKTLQ